MVIIQSLVKVVTIQIPVKIVNLWTFENVVTIENLIETAIILTSVKAVIFVKRSTFKPKEKCFPGKNPVKTFVIRTLVKLITFQKPVNIWTMIKVVARIRILVNIVGIWTLIKH